MSHNNIIIMECSDIVLHAYIIYNLVDVTRVLLVDRFAYQGKNRIHLCMSIHDAKTTVNPEISMWN